MMINPDHYTIVHSRCPICMEPVGQAVWLPDVFDDGIVCVEHGVIPEWFLEDYPNLTGAEAVIQLRSLQAMHEIGVMARAAVAKVNKDLDEFRQMERLRRIVWFFAHDEMASIREYRFAMCGWKMNAYRRLGWFDDTETP